MIERFAQRSVSRAPLDVTASSPSLVIRVARDADLPGLHDLAELDSSAPLAGAALVAIVDGRPWAAIGLGDGRVIADPFVPSAEAVGLLRLRVRQLGVAAAQPRLGTLRRRVAGRAGAS